MATIDGHGRSRGQTAVGTRRGWTRRAAPRVLSTAASLVGVWSSPTASSAAGRRVERTSCPDFSTASGTDGVSGSNDSTQENILLETSAHGLHRAVACSSADQVHYPFGGPR